MDYNHSLINDNSTYVYDMYNGSDEVDLKLMERYLKNKGIDEPAYTILIVFYCFLIIVGALGNTLVIVSVVRKPAMRTPRNMFIFNLAVADLILCTVTMPLTLMEILTKYFPLGNNLFICKLIGILQATSTYVSTISISAIALDRYQVIVYPTKEGLQLCGALLILLLIWLVALGLALPLFIVRHLIHHSISLGTENLNLNFCIENWPVEHGRAYYSIFSLIFQYTLPIIIVSAAYVRISYKLRYRFASGFVGGEDTQKNRRELRGRRLHRTNLLLGSIAVIFCVSWLPLNVFNLVADLSTSQSFTSQPMMICYAICHMMGMSSACSNPVLYGCLNENFWKEFKDILCIQSSSENAGASKKTSFKKSSHKVQSKARPDLVTGADYQLCNTRSHQNENYLDQHEDNEIYNENILSTPSTSRVSRTRKIKKVNNKDISSQQENELLQMTTSVLNRPNDENTVFGEYVASELRQLGSDVKRSRLKRVIQNNIIIMSEEDNEFISPFNALSLASNRDKQFLDIIESSNASTSNISTSTLF